MIALKEKYNLAAVTHSYFASCHGKVSVAHDAVAHAQRKHCTLIALIVAALRRARATARVPL